MCFYSWRSSASYLPSSSLLQPFPLRYLPPLFHVPILSSSLFCLLSTRLPVILLSLFLHRFAKLFKVYLLQFLFPCLFLFFYTYLMVAPHFFLTNISHNFFFYSKSSITLLPVFRRLLPSFQFHFSITPCFQPFQSPLPLFPSRLRPTFPCLTSVSFLPLFL